jgi:hypothetical protein
MSTRIRCPKRMWLAEMIRFLKLIVLILLAAMPQQVFTCVHEPELHSLPAPALPANDDDCGASDSEHQRDCETNVRIGHVPSRASTHVDVMAGFIPVDHASTIDLPEFADNHLLKQFQVTPPLPVYLLTARLRA